jgi:hypothetical protein
MDLKQSAIEHKAKTTKNIADLEVVRLDYPIQDKEGLDKDGKIFKYKVIVANGEEYRVPESVLGDIQSILTAKPNLKTVKVIKKGTGMSTSYNVISLD